jgi:hypothetical protein
MMAVMLCVVQSFTFLTGYAQELTPRAYWPAPDGTKFLVAGFAHSTGDIITDPSLPVVGVDSRINTTVLAYRQTLGFAGRTSTLQIELPYVDGNTSGTVSGLQVDREFGGLGDLAVTWDVNLAGAPSMTTAEFMAFRRNPSPLLAASIKVVAPTGEYETEKLINISSNRWAAKGKLGYLRPIRGIWVLELGAGAWFFGDNDEFLGQTRQQEPVGAFDLSVVRRFRPGFWASIDTNYYVGGRTVVGGTKRADLQRNSRIGISLAYPLAGRHGIKLGYSTGAVTEAGGDFENFLLNYIYRLD